MTYPAENTPREVAAGVQAAGVFLLDEDYAGIRMPAFGLEGEV